MQENVLHKSNLPPQFIASYAFVANMERKIGIPTAIDGKKLHS